MAGYGIRAYLIAQSLNQIEKAYGPNNSILDNCHIRIAFATNDERTAKRVSDALGTTTELRAQKNYTGHRLAPWLSHMMVSRQETQRALVTPGEVMQLPPTDQIVLVSGSPPVMAKKLRYFEDKNFTARVLPPAPVKRQVKPEAVGWPGCVMPNDESPSAEAKTGLQGLERKQTRESGKNARDRCSGLRSQSKALSSIVNDAGDPVRDKHLDTIRRAAAYGSR